MKKLTFTCPVCGGHRLGQLQEVLVLYPVTEIQSNGNLEYDLKNRVEIDGTTVDHQCMDCDTVLVNEKGVIVDDIMEVPKWVRKHCPQPKKNKIRN